MMPADKLRQPACTAATPRPWVSARSTGRQSATCTTHTTPGVTDVAASASTASVSINSASTTVVPCTCVIQRGASSVICATILRFMHTHPALSPTCVPTLSPMMPSLPPQGPEETPPRRSVKTAPTFSPNSGCITSKSFLKKVAMSNSSKSADFSRKRARVHPWDRNPISP